MLHCYLGGSASKGVVLRKAHTQASGYTRRLDACTKLNDALKQLNWRPVDINVASAVCHVPCSVMTGGLMRLSLVWGLTCSHPEVAGGEQSAIYFIRWSGEQSDRQANMTGRLVEVWCGAGRSRLQKTGKASGYFFRRASCRCSDSPDIH